MRISTWFCCVLPLAAECIVGIKRVSRHFQCLRQFFARGVRAFDITWQAVQPVAHEAGPVSLTIVAAVPQDEERKPGLCEGAAAGGRPRSDS